MNEEFNNINKKVSAFIIVSAALAIPATVGNTQANAADVSAVKPSPNFQAGMLVTKYGCPSDPVIIKPQPPMLRYAGPIRPIPETKADVPIIRYDASEATSIEANKSLNNNKSNSDVLPDNVMNYFDNKRIIMENKFNK